MRAPRRLGRVRRQDELERDRRGRAPLDAGRVPARAKRERLASDSRGMPLLALVLAPAAHAVVLLGDVRELEVERERAQHRAPGVRGRAPRTASRSSSPRRALAAQPRARRADPLLVGEQLLALLLDEHLAEHVAEQADVAAQRRVGAHAGRR